VIARVLAVAVLLLVAPTSAPASAAVKPVWKFTIQVKIAQATAVRHGGLVYVISKALTQMETIEARFNDPGVFNGTFAFDITEAEEFAGPTSEELKKPHSTTDLKIIYDEDADVGGGAYGETQTIVHKWPDSLGGSFAPSGTDGLTHELGHHRSATDEYAGNVLATNNPVSGTGYAAPPSVMSQPYGVNNWSPYSVGLINMAGSTPGAFSPALASKALPPLQVRVLNTAGKPVKARVRFYPVPWFQERVQATPTVDKYTSATTGYYKFAASPYKPGMSTDPWNLAYCNFLVRINYGTKTTYRWLPIATVGESYFKSSTAPHTLTVQL